MAKTTEQVKEEARVRARLWYRNNKARHRATMKAWEKKNQDKVNARRRELRANNHEKIISRQRSWVAKNKEKNAAYKTKYRDNNRDRVRRSAREYLSRRRETDANLKIRYALRGRICQALKSQGTIKTNKTMCLVGCDKEFLRGYLEARFQPGMTWANHGQGKGKWHIDHTIPCAEFDLRDPAQQKQCFHYSNLRPMWGAENVRKGAKRPPTHQAELI